MGLSDEIGAVREAAQAFVDDGESLEGVVPTEPAGGARVYLCSYANGRGRRWLAVDAAGRAITNRRLVRDAVAIAALCELAEETAGGGDVPELRARLLELRLTENPDGIDEAEAAAAELAKTLRRAPRVASLSYLDSIGAAAARLEQSLGDHGSPFAEAMKVGAGAAEQLAGEVERSYKAALA